MSQQGFGLIGTGFMGRAHAIALGSVARVFDGVTAPRCVALADNDAATAKRAARDLGFERGTGDWRELLDDPAINVIDICTPNYLHAEMALAAIRAGKHVYCEKPLALDVDEASQLARAAAEAGVVHAVGLNYTTNPMIGVARDMIAAGELGDLTAFSGRYFEDYMSSADVPYSWRCERRLAGSGALADLGSHLINLLHYLLGRPRELVADLKTLVPMRKDPATGQLRKVENEDIARALIELESGMPATFEISRIATGYKCGLTFELFGTRGAIAFDQERMNELRVYQAGDRAGRRGYKTILAGPEHRDYGRFCPAPGHGLGINDLKVIEVYRLLAAIEQGKPFWPDFEEGLAVQKVMAAMETSAVSGERVTLDWRD